MNVAVVGAGHIGGNIARRFAAAGHDVTVSWGAIPDALAQCGSLAARIVIDTTNQFGPAPQPAPGQRVVQWLCGDDGEAKAVVAELIESAGYVPVDLGGTRDCAVMEAPRRPGAVYGEEYRLPDAEQVVAAVRAGRPIPPTPRYP